MYTINDCTDENPYEINLEGRYLILKPEFFTKDFKLEQYQLVLATGGFGCDPNKLGNAIFVKEILPEPEIYRIERCNKDILGIAKDSVVAAHKEKYL